MLHTDLLLENATVITLDRASSITKAIKVRDGHIVAVGESAALSHNGHPDTRRIDLRGKTIVPGFCDAHPHMDREGLRARGGIPIAGLRSITDITAVVARAVRSVPPGEWIVLMPLGNPPHDYFNRAEQIAEGRFPNRYDLDAVAPHNPVYIRAVWGYWSIRPFPSVANSMALQQVGITRKTTAPHNVEILRDTQGEPTGVFLERNYTPILEYTLFKQLPRFTQTDRIDSVRLGARAFNEVGTTAAYEGHGLSPAIIRAYRDVHDRGELTIRMHTPLSIPSAAFDDATLADLFYHYAGVASDRGVRKQGVPLRNLLNAGVPIALGTDGVPPSMLWTMWEALKRWHAASQTSLGESQISREEALRMSVQTGHLLTWSEDRRGSLEVGKQADLVVLDANPLTCPLDDIKDLTVELTMVAGRIVYQKEEAVDTH